MDVILLTALAFLLSAIPFSLFIGRLVFGVDIRQYGDGNPGATNVYRASHSRFWMLVAIILDSFKGTVFVTIAYWGLYWHDLRIVPVAIAAVAGHAFSPFLGFRGGKAVAVTFGVWMAFTLYLMPIVLGIQLGLWYRLIRESEWVVIFMMLGGLVFLLLFHRHQTAWLLIWLGNFLILAYKHRAGLYHWPTFLTGGER